MALSTNIPTANANPPKVIIFNVILLKYNKINEAINEIGIDTPTIKVDLIFFRKIYKTAMANIEPTITLSITLLMESFIIVELSITILILISG